jgi:PilZ domain
MRRLRHHQRVEIHLNGGEEVVPCLVLGVERAVATLATIDPGLIAQLGGSMHAAPGYLLFDHGGRRVALKGIATTAGTSEQSEVLFVVIDGVQLPERRSAERVEVDGFARLFPPVSAGLPEYIDTPLADLSISGVRVERHPGLAERVRYRLELYLGDARSPICCDAEVARATARHLGMKFIELQASDRVLLAAIVDSARSYSERDLVANRINALKPPGQSNAA